MGHPAWNKGKSGYWLGKKRSAEDRKKISESLRGRKLSIETKAKLKGRKSWNKGKSGYKTNYPKVRRGAPLTEEHKNKIRESVKKDHKLYPRKLSEETKNKLRVSSTGRVFSQERCKKISESKKGKAPFRGSLHPNWKGGISFEEYPINWTATLRRSIRERDRYTCKICSLQQGDKVLDIHHIDYNKKNCNPENLITLCHRCHPRTNYNREYWKEFFKKFNLC